MSKLDPSQGLAVFTDGSAYTGDRSGGWGWVALDAFDGMERDSGHAPDTTIGRMELFAPTHALISLYESYGKCNVLVYSDSEYVVFGMKDPTRKRNKNRDLWRNLTEAAWLHDTVRFTHVRGHADSDYNNMADKLAGAARKRLPQPDLNMSGVRNTDPGTSHQAALDNFPRSGSQRARCIQHVFDSESDGKTASEAEEELGLPTSSTAKRFGEAEEQGWIMRDGRTRTTSRGSQGSVYVMTPEGRVQWKEHYDLCTSP